MRAHGPAYADRSETSGVENLGRRREADQVEPAWMVARLTTLRRVTDLFLHDGERLSEDQVRVFDDVLCHLVARVETRVKAELSARLASLEYAPTGVIEHLACDDEIAVAGNVLGGSTRLTTSTL